MSASPAPPSSGADFRLLGLAPNGIAFRATRGSCTTATTMIESSTDNGVTWQNVKPTDVDIRESDSLTVVDGSHVDLLAKVGADCQVTAVSTYTQGEFWQSYPNRASTLSAASLPSDSPIRGVYAVAEVGDSALVARFGSDQCAGLAIEGVPTVTSSDARLLGCISQVTEPTPLAIAALGSSMWVWVGDSIYRSYDSGATWALAS